MVGREALQHEVIVHIESVLKSTSQENVLFITGEAGIGKSTFLKAVAEKTASLSSAPIVVIAECSTPLAGQNIGEAEALKPWVDAVDVIVRQSAEGVKNQKKSKFDIGKFLLDTAPAWIELIPVFGSTISAGVEILGAGFDQVYMNKKADKAAAAMSQQQIFQQYINLLQKITETTPLVIILDDFHWADDSSCNLLFAAARQVVKKPIVFIIAYRPDDVLTSRDGQQHAILHIKNELERYELSREIQVPRLTANNLDTLMRSRFKDYVNNDEFEEWMAHIGGGNALFITQFLKTLEEDGFLKKDTGEFTGDYDAVTIPKSALAVVNERIRRLSSDAREMLQYASVEGETFTASVLSKLTEMPQLKSLQKLRALEETHKVIETLGKQMLYAKETTAYRFSHALLHRAMYETLGEEERELLHEAILEVLKSEWQEVLENNINIATIANRIAVHAEIAKDYFFAAEVLLKAAQMRWNEFAESEAMQNIASALILLGKMSKQNEKSNLLKGELLFLRGKIHEHKWRYQKALDDWQEAATFFQQYNVESRILDVEVRSGYVSYSMGNADESIENFQKLLNENNDILSTTQKTIILGLIGIHLTATDKPQEAVLIHLEELKLSRDAGVRLDEIRALIGLGCAAGSNKDFEASIRYFKDALFIAQEQKNTANQATILNNMANMYSMKGDYEEALSCNYKALEITRLIGLTQYHFSSLSRISGILTKLEQYEPAIRHYSEAVEICRNSDNIPDEVLTLYRMALTYLKAEDFSKAKEVVFYIKELSEEARLRIEKIYPGLLDANNELLKTIEEIELKPQP